MPDVQACPHLQASAGGAAVCKTHKLQGAGFTLSDNLNMCSICQLVGWCSSSLQDVMPTSAGMLARALMNCRGLSCARASKTARRGWSATCHPGQSS